MIKHIIHTLLGHKLANGLIFLLLIATSIVMMQSIGGALDKLWYFRDARGYDPENVGQLFVQSKSGNTKKDSVLNQNLYKELKHNPLLSGISRGSLMLIYEGIDKNNMIGFKGKPFDAYFRFVDEYAASVMDIKMLYGSWFTEADAHSDAVILSIEAAKKLFGEIQVTNRTFVYQNKKYYVKGICNSIRQSKSTPPSPTIFHYNIGNMGFFFKIKPGQNDNFSRSIESIVSSVYGPDNYVIGYECLNYSDHVMNSANSFRLRSFLKTKLFMVLVTAFSIISVLWYMIERRKEELGIRFVLGRTLNQLIFYIQSENYFLFFPAYIIAVIIAFNFQYAGVELLSKDHLGISLLISFILMFALTTLGVLIPCLRIKRLQVTEIIKSE